MIMNYEWDDNVLAAVKDIIGYLNFSSGSFEPRFMAGWNTVFTFLDEHGSEKVWSDSRELLRQGGEKLAAESDAFRHIDRARHVLDLVFEKVLPAYRRFHADLLFHQTDEFLFNPFFIAKACSQTLTLESGWNDEEGTVNEVIRLLNDFLGYRPIPVFEDESKHEPDPHEWVAPLPLYVKGVGVAWGPYQAMVTETLDILRNTDPALLRDAWFDPDRMEELVLDPRAYDFDHPANRRPNYSFGTWDFNAINKDGYYRRFVVHQVSVDGMLERTRQTMMAPPDMNTVPTKGLILEAGAVLAGTMLMGSGITGDHVQTHDSTVSLANLMTGIANYRDRFYDGLIKKIPDSMKPRMEFEAKRLFQPFGGARQDLNKYLAKKRADQLQRFHLSRTYARMGYFEAAKKQAAIISVTSARFLCQIDCHIAQAHMLADRKMLKEAYDILPQVEDLLHRGIACGALPDPWTILGFGAEYTLFISADSVIHDHRIDDLIHLMNDIFDLYSRLQKEAAVSGLSDLQADLSDAMSDLAGWWDQFGSTEISGIEGFSGQAVWESAAKVSTALATWHHAGPAAGNVAFWRRHVERFKSPKAFVLLGEALLEQGDLISSMALLMHWLSESQMIPLSEGDYSFHAITIRWMEQLWQKPEEEQKADGEPGTEPAAVEETASPQSPIIPAAKNFKGKKAKEDAEVSVPPTFTLEEFTDRWKQASVFLDRLEANADIYWNVPTLDLAPDRFDKPAFSIEFDDQKNIELKNIDPNMSLPKNSDPENVARPPAETKMIDMLGRRDDFNGREFFSEFCRFLSVLRSGSADKSWKMQAFKRFLAIDAPIKKLLFTYVNSDEEATSSFLCSFFETFFLAFHPDFSHRDKIDELTRQNALHPLNENLDINQRLDLFLNDLSSGDSQGPITVMASGGTRGKTPVNYLQELLRLVRQLQKLEDKKRSHHDEKDDPTSYESDDDEGFEYYEPGDETFGDDIEDEDEDRGIDPLYRAAYENMKFRDSAEDGIDDEMMEAGGKSYNDEDDSDLNQEINRINERLAFIFTMVKLWKMLAGKILLMEPEERNRLEVSERLTTWLEQVCHYREDLYSLLDQVSLYRVPTPNGTAESMMEYDQHRGTKEILLDRIVWSIVEINDTNLFMEAILYNMTALPGSKTEMSFPNDESLPAWRIKIRNVFAAIFNCDHEKLGTIWESTLSSLEKETLLYIPTSRGGDARLIVQCRCLQQVVLRLFEYLPRLGCLIESFQLLQSVQTMEQIRPNLPGAITEFDRIFESATKGISRCIVDSSKSWRIRPRANSKFQSVEDALISYTESAVDILLGCWLSHSRHIRISSVEAIMIPGPWDSVKNFIIEYGEDLFTQQFLNFRNIRAILHQGVGIFIDELIRMNQEDREVEAGTHLVEDILGGKIPKDRAIFYLEVILECVAENYSEYIDYNSTTTQSDHGEKLYILLDMLRVLTGYERVSWNLKPVYWVHEVIVRFGELKAATLWEQSISRKSHGLSDENLRSYNRLNAMYGIWLPSVHERLQERFIRPLQVDRMCALVGQAVKDIRANATSNPASPNPDAGASEAFAELEKQVEEFAKTPMGVGFEVPEWLDSLQEEVIDTQVDDRGFEQETDLEFFGAGNVFKQIQLSRREIDRQITYCRNKIYFGE